ncbi:hypothetical protein RF11_00728 [Thelohanellus kitauei]|uniref:Uncharacterized protein n=1 Tax=Thelohanellus kitauei TaxID=669202 RepID=A0A0C2JA45_THEKT|nr:hypothetical protein RF11_00728 [Thelohanellus kitauei]
MSDWIDDVHFHFDYPSVPESIIHNTEHLESFAEEVELGLLEAVEEITSQTNKPDLIQMYEIVLTDKYYNSVINFLNILKNVLTNTILHSELPGDAHKLILGLRVLYTMPSLIRRFPDNFFEDILTRIIYLASHAEEPIATHAIKCLQIFAYNGKRLSKFAPQLKELFDVLVSNLLNNFMQVCDEYLASLQSIEGQGETFIPKFDKSQIGTQECDPTDFEVNKFCLNDHIDQQSISAIQQKFHYIALIYYLLPILKVKYLEASNSHN